MDKILLTGKNVIVTGSNCGIGYATALDFAKRGANIILACRDVTKASQARDEIINESKNGNVEVEALDLGQSKSIKEFSERIKNKWNHLDILVNNAGLYINDYAKTIDGFEMHFGVNYLGPYYLTRLLLDLIKKSAPSRIVNVSSLAYKGCKINWDDVNMENNFSGFKAYGQSKLGNILFTNELANKLKGTSVTVTSLHPGFVDTEIFRSREDQSFKTTLMFCVMPFARLFANKTSDGAKTSIYCSISEDVPKNSGSYFSDCKVEVLTPEGRDEEAAKRLWDLSAKLVGLEP